MSSAGDTLGLACLSSSEAGRQSPASTGPGPRRLPGQREGVGAPGTHVLLAGCSQKPELRPLQGSPPSPHREEWLGGEQGAESKAQGRQRSQRGSRKKSSEFLLWLSGQRAQHSVHEDAGSSPGSLSGLEICSRSRMQLGSHIAVAVV